MREPVGSVIICTRNRPRQLLACVASVAAAAARCPELPAEIIVVENSPDPRLALDPAAVLEAAGGRGRFIALPVSGLSNARNAGMSAAQGRLLIFTDDDCLMDPDFMRDLLRHDAEGPEDMFLGGRVKLGDPTDLPFTIKDEPAEQLYEPSIHPGGFVPGCSFVLSRTTAERIGSFDTTFGAGAAFQAGEDTDYIIRGHMAGVPIRYVPDMCVRHHHGRKQLAEVVDLSRAYSYANGALYGKYIRQTWLLKHFFWSLRSAWREARGGPSFRPELGISWSQVARANIAGFAAFFLRRPAFLRPPAAARPAARTMPAIPASSRLDA